MDLAFGSRLSEGFTSRSQVARVLTQDWVARQLPCLSCSPAPLSATPQNTRARDFLCGSCSEPYELKSKSSPFGKVVADGQYDTLVETIRDGRTPNLLLLHYDASALRVRALEAIHRSLLSVMAVRSRTPLSSSARRAGWQACMIDLTHLPGLARVPIVHDGQLVPWHRVTSAWARFNFMMSIRPDSRGWIQDVLACVQELGTPSFRLADVYRYESKLAALHPTNRNVRPKIRQQLQVLVAQGLLRRLVPGVYQSTGAKTG